MKRRNNTQPENVEKVELTLPSGIPEGFSVTPPEGLSAEEAGALLAAGKGGGTDRDTGKTTGEILKSNLLTFFNLLNLALALALFLVGSYRNMLFVLIIISNAAIGTFQELRARNTIRRLKLLNTPSVRVMRGGAEQQLSPEQIVTGDRMILYAGDQIPADSIVLEGTGSAVEALLTGESDAIPKAEGCWLYSGSYVTEGKLTAQAIHTGDESYIGRLTKEAKRDTRPKSALMTDLEKLIRFDTAILVPAGVLLFVKQYFITRSAELPVAVSSSVAAMIGMIPEGLILLTSVALAVGVVKLGRRNTLVQELYGIETLARVDTLCLDKTGTITTGQMRVADHIPLETDDSELIWDITRFLGAFDDPSGTLDALRSSYDPGSEKPTAVLPFSSERKLSAASFADDTTLILGAAEFVLGESMPRELAEQISSFTSQGCRVVLLAEARGIIENGVLPPVTKLCGLFVLTDRIRPSAAETIRYFYEQGVSLKIISGDDPRTVSKVAQAVGLRGCDCWLDVSALKSDAELEDLCEKTVIFGRVTPARKKQIVEMLRAKGHHVAMTGDGVNDIPAMKSADCSIAMAGGADAARSAAQLTLLDSDFASMPAIVLEGRRVVNNITRASSLFLTKTLFSFGLCILSILLPGMVYPFQPIQLTLVSCLTVGFPSFLLAFEPSDERIRGNFLKTVLMRAIPGGLAVALCAAICMHMQGHYDLTYGQCSTVATLIAGAVGLIVLLRACLPLNRIRGAIFALMVVLFTGVSLLFGSIFYLERLSAAACILFTVLTIFSAGIILLTARLLNKGK
ncbi:MAG: HAD-IC family P-type ATPase [Clostridia bacterium]|nr:HAD-IC family P-type ATPase [Clostridia bacterium]